MFVAPGRLRQSDLDRRGRDRGLAALVLQQQNKNTHGLLARDQPADKLLQQARGAVQQGIGVFDPVKSLDAR